MALILSGDTGPSFVQSAAMPTGSVIQTVNATYAVQQSTTSSTYTTTNLSATITPISTSSKILIIANIAASTYGSSSVGGGLQIVRGSTVVCGSLSGTSYLLYTTTSEVNWPAILSALDSPATTSPITYTVNMNAQSGQTITQSNSNPSYLTLMEIHG